MDFQIALLSIPIITDIHGISQIPNSIWASIIQHPPPPKKTTNPPPTPKIPVISKVMTYLCLTAQRPPFSI